MLAFLGEAHRKAGQTEEGLALLDEAQALVAKTGERTAEAEVHRRKGELLFARSPSDQTQAEASFGEALEVARRQSARSWKPRAAARLWQLQSKREAARAISSRPSTPGSPKASTRRT
jgi:predicted ATPase